MHAITLICTPSRSYAPSRSYTRHHAHMRAITLTCLWSLEALVCAFSREDFTEHDYEHGYEHDYEHGWSMCAACTDHRHRPPACFSRERACVLHASRGSVADGGGLCLGHDAWGMMPGACSRLDSLGRSSRLRGWCSRLVLFDQSGALRGVGIHVAIGCHRLAYDIGRILALKLCAEGGHLVGTPHDETVDPF